jgi:hypothetical protein
MAFSREEWADILVHTRRRVREAGLVDLDERVTLDFRTTQSAGEDFLRYLDSLISAVSERSHSTYRRAMEIFQHSVSTQSGRAVQGIEVQIADADRVVYGADRVDLADNEDWGETLRELKGLREVIEGLLNEEGST